MMKTSLYYKIVWSALHLFYRKPKTTFEIAPDDEPSVFVGNHSSIHGPVLMTLFFPRKHKTWVISCALDPSKCANYAYHDIFFGESRKHKRIWRFFGQLIRIALPPLLRDADTIPVYHSAGITKTFRQSLAALQDGDDLVIFGESPARFSEYVHELQPGFIDLAKLYYRKTGKKLKFYPFYAERKTKTIAVGAPVAYDPAVPLPMQRDQIATYLRDSIDRLGRSLPPHTPVPFLPERWYSAYGQYEQDVMGYWQLME